MKFCKNLEKVIALINVVHPDWAPFWVNYKMLKKTISSQLSNLVPPMDDEYENENRNDERDDHRRRRDEEDSSGGIPIGLPDAKRRRVQICEAGEATTSTPRPVLSPTTAATRICDTSVKNDDATATSTATFWKLAHQPAERIFFQMLHEEVRKASRFFESTLRELEIREERVRAGVNLLVKYQNTSPRNRNSALGGGRHDLLATTTSLFGCTSSCESWPNSSSKQLQSLHRLYKDLLLLETYAIMNYCSFSKILKKHDKVAGHQTRVRFMKNVVDKQNFANYPQLMTLINRCNDLISSQSSIQPNTSNSSNTMTREDEQQLMIDMVCRLNKQALVTAQDEGAPNVLEKRKGRYNNTTAATAAIINWNRTTTSNDLCDNKEQLLCSSSYYCASHDKVIASLCSLVEQYGTVVEAT